MTYYSHHWGSKKCAHFTLYVGIMPWVPGKSDCGETELSGLPVESRHSGLLWLRYLKRSSKLSYCS